jgi:four helix bundle protein
VASVTSFQDLIAWQKARALTREIYFVTREPGFGRDPGLASQIQRASVSVMANLAEGFERRRRTEFFRYVEIAKSSCAEVSSHLFVALDVGYLNDSDHQRLQEQTGELLRILGGLRNSLAPARASELGTRNS